MTEALAQRAIVIGEQAGNPGKVVEVRARMVVPSLATLLEAPGVKLSLRGMWSQEKGYFPFGTMIPPMGPENQFPFEIQSEGEDDPNLVFQVQPLTVILEDQKVFGDFKAKSTPALREYHARYFPMGEPFDFEATWDRAGQH